MLCRVASLGIVPYLQAWELQKGVVYARQQDLIPDLLLLLEHPPTYTNGRGSSGRDHLLASQEALKQEGASIYEVDRGGDVTFHGPGQLIGYPIIDLKAWQKDAHLYVWQLEEVLICALADLGISAHRNRPYVGVWAGDAKIAAIGIKLSHWVTCHGFALNIDPDLTYFRHIVPCGIPNCAITSVTKVFGGPVDEGWLRQQIIHHFGVAFGRRMVDASPLPPRV
jgi:lipoate-protein ligase B